MSKEKKIDDSELSEVSGAGDPNAIIDLDTRIGDGVQQQAGTLVSWNTLGPPGDGPR